MGGNFDDMELRDALDDMMWVVRRMTDMPATPVGGKRAKEYEADTQMKKRYVLSLPNTSQANAAMSQKENRVNSKAEEES